MDTIRVVLADDHAEFRRVVREFLRKLPHVEVVAEAADGTEAIEHVARHGPHVVLMDVSMPSMNGIEATKIIKERWPATQVLIATTHDSRIYRLQAENAGADAYVMKADLKPVLESFFGQAVLPRSTSSRIAVPSTPSPRTSSPSTPSKEQS